jgi:hypothetical protein
MIFNQQAQGGSGGGGGGAYAIFCPFRDALDLPASADGGDEVTMTVTDSSAISMKEDVFVGTSPKNASDIRDFMGGPGAFDDGAELVFTMPSQDVMVTRSKTDWA